jgi:membrane protein implicated in regulation of membrane protease activity
MLDLESLILSPWVWALLFVLLMVTELSTSTFVAGFLAIGAIVTAFCIEYNVADTPLEVLLSWLASTCVAAVLLYGPLKRRYSGRSTTDVEEGIAPFINDTGVVSDGDLTARTGTIRLHGADMRAVLKADHAQESCPEGTQVVVLSQRQDGVFIVDVA